MNFRPNRPQPPRRSIDPRPLGRHIARDVGLGRRWAVKRPLLVGPMVDTVLRRALRPIVIHRTDVRFGVSNSSFVDDRRHTSIHWQRIDRRAAPSTLTSPAGRPRQVTRHFEARRAFHQRLLRARAHTRIDATHRRQERRSTAGEFTPVSPSIRHRVSHSDGSDALTSRPSAVTTAPIAGRYASAARPTLGRDHRGPKSPLPSPSTRSAALASHAETPRVDRARPAPPAAIDVDDLTRRVVDAIDRRLISHRERMGRP